MSQASPLRGQKQGEKAVVIRIFSLFVAGVGVFTHAFGNSCSKSQPESCAPSKKRG
jgi:hypothetical protein